ncbi:MAG: iron uptake porin [Pseudanabaenaceae cyanobacterium SKYGB_i_bin29]|nr:iron uptake porin [Pseudanabaenaceae cyanobacterium SKYG29]MDW8422631.1 iron uptake porin [Pseudanabaenaceae cyanobacterium SKYGB_i_bin29]
MARLTFVTVTSLVMASSAMAVAQAQTVTQNNDSILIRNISRDPLSRPKAGNPSNISQVTSVSELSDVRPTDWAFSALQSLVERYGCIEGYPNRTYRGNRALTRYEFAAGLNACLDKINEIISAGLADKVSKEDLATLQRLQEEFAAELAAIKGRVDALEKKVDTLEKQQFSTTTKLAGTVLFVPAFATSAVGGSVGRDRNSNFVLGARVRLNFNTSFTGRDLLRTRLQFGNVTTFNSATVGTNMARLGFDLDTSGNFQIDDLWYRFPIGDSITAFIGVNAMDLDDVLDPVSRIASSDTGAISRFHRFDPLMFRGPEGAGLGLQFKVSEAFDINLAYLVPSGAVAQATGQAGLTNGDYSASIQLLFKPSRDLKLSALYSRRFDARGVNLTASTSTGFAANPFNADTSADVYGFAFDWAVARGFTLGGNISFANARSEAAPNRGATADLLTWAVNVTFPDLFGSGNLGAIAFGQPPRVTSTSLPAAANVDARGTSYNLEIFYRYRVSRNINIQPGVFFVFNPDSNNANNTLVVGVLRTTFSF